jgi:hypothetical protein
LVTEETIRLLIKLIGEIFRGDLLWKRELYAVLLTNEMSNFLLNSSQNESFGVGWSLEHLLFIITENNDQKIIFVI